MVTLFISSNGNHYWAYMLLEQTALKSRVKQRESLIEARESRVRQKKSRIKGLESLINLPKVLTVVRSKKCSIDGSQSNTFRCFLRLN